MIYSEFIDLCNSKKLLVQYRLYENDVDKEYHIYAIDGRIQYNTRINNTDHSVDVANFEDNYKDNSNDTIDKRDSFTKQPIFKPRNVEGSAFMGAVYFTTGDDQSLDHPSNYTEWSIAVNTEKTLTQVSFNPPYGYYIDGGEISIEGEILVDVKCQFVLAPDIAPFYFLDNKKFNGDLRKWSIVRPTKYVAYNETYTMANELRITVEHGSSDSIKMEAIPYLYKL